MTAPFVNVVFADDSIVHWVGFEDISVAPSLGRYERGAIAAGTKVASAIASLVSALPSMVAIDVVFDNAPSAVIIGDSSFPESDQISAIVSVKWQEAERRGTAQDIDAIYGADAYRFRGIVDVTFAAPWLGGDGSICESIDYLADQLRFEDEWNIHFETPESVASTVPLVSAPGTTGLGQYARSVSIPFYIDEDNPRIGGAVGSAANTDRVEEVCNTRFRDLVATPNTVSVVYINAPPPPIQSGSVWVVLDVIYGSTDLVSLGVTPPSAVGHTPQRYRTTGIFQVSIEVDEGMGDADALHIADAIFDTFHDAADRGVQFKTPAIVVSGRVGTYWRIVVSIPFHAEQIK